MKAHYEVLIVGAGTAGIMTAAQLIKKKPSLKIGIIDPATTHFYQPAWTLVGAGTYDFDKTARPMRDMIPKGVTWLKEYATRLDPDQNRVLTKENEYTYDHLVVCPGLIMDPSMIEGLEESLGKGVVCSNYTDPEHTWSVIKNFKGGNALFTQPATPIKCGGAPQKIMYLASDYFRKNNMLDKSNVIFATPGTVIFGVKPIKETLTKVLNRYGVLFKPFHTPVKIDAKRNVATFQIKSSEHNDCMINKEETSLGFRTVGDSLIEMPFDMLHLAPPQRAPDFVSKSPLALETGWMAVDKNSMQSTKYDNVYGLGDVAGVPTAKTGAAIRKQAPIVVNNILSQMAGKGVTDTSYNGYSSCPLVTGYGKMVLAEFDYDNNFTPDPKLKQMLVFDSSKEHWRLWMLKKYMLPYLYWNKMMKGKNV